MKYALLLGSMALGVIGQLFLKKGVAASTLSPNLGSIIGTIFSPYVFLGLAFYGLSAVIWLFVLQRFPLSVAYPSLALTYIAVIFLSFFLIHEPIKSTQVIGTFLIIAGVVFLFR